MRLLRLTLFTWYNIKYYSAYSMLLRKWRQYVFLIFWNLHEQIWKRNVLVYKCKISMIFHIYTWNSRDEGGALYSVRASGVILRGKCETRYINKSKIIAIFEKHTLSENKYYLWFWHTAYMLVLCLSAHLYNLNRFIIHQLLLSVLRANGL